MKMSPKYHIIINLVISWILLIFLSPIYVLIFFLASFLIDADHYLYYIIEKKNLSLRKAYNWFSLRKSRMKQLTRKERKKHHDFFLIFHGAEPIILLFVFSKFFYPLFFIFLAMLVHLIEDLTEDIPFGLFERKLFLSYALYLHFRTKLRENNSRIK